MMTPSFDLKRLWTMLNDRLRRTVTRALTQRVAGYDLKAPNDMTRVYGCIQRGDVVLVEGELRISQLVKYATQSPWSHSALYVGDEMLRRGGRFREQAVAHFGELADRLLVEALTHEGVVVAPLAKYEWHNIRICRPHGIRPADLDKVIDSVIADLGKRYDNRNFLDLTLMLLSPIKFGPLRRQTIETCLGNCTDLQVICSGMIAKAFHRVGYPILPELDVSEREDGNGAETHSSPYRFPRRHYSQIAPRDFDLSPNFEIVKFGTAGGAGSWVRPRRRTRRPASSPN